jgi:CRP-like cAMP-binding protein/thioredoxin reductase
MTAKVTVAVIGSGPAGLSCAARAAEVGVSHVLLEAEGQASFTIYRYQKGKHVMAEPAILPLRSPIEFAAGRREAVLAKWNEGLARHKVNIQYNSRVTGITGAKGAFEIKTAAGAAYQAEHIVLSIGLQGNLRKLGVPGEDLEMVQYQLDDPDEFNQETIIVVGAGDAAIENALALAAKNRVIMINRNDEFARCKQGNLDLVLAAIKDGKLECRFGTTSIGVEPQETDGRRGCYLAQTPVGVELIPCDRVIARLGATPPRKLVEQFGVRFPSADPAAVPQVSATYESNVPGLYVIGALGGYPLIKQAMNQGYEVVEYIRGQPVEPADEPLLRKKFSEFAQARGVAEALALVQRNVPLFKDMTTLQLREFMLESDVRAPKAGEIIFRKDDYTNSFFSIVDGEVLVESVGKDGKVGHISLKRGQFFGELGLLSGRRRTATVKAGEKCVLLETPRRSMLKLIASIESVRQQVDYASLRRAVRTHIAPWISPADLEEMIGDAVIKTFNAGETLFAEGAPADGLHLIRRGSVMVVQSIGGREIVLSYVAAGHYIGEMALLSDSPRTATVRAAVKTETIMLQAKTFNEVLSRNATLRGGCRTTSGARTGPSRATSSASCSTRGWGRRPTCS